MQFSTFSRLEEELIITLYNEIPIENVGSIINYSDNSQGTFNRKEIRWSFDSVYWSSWESLTQNSISRIDIHNNYYFFIQIRYVLNSIDSGTVSTFALNYNVGTATPSARDRVISPPETNEDADTLNGYSGDYYLNRSHHKGYQPISSITGLQTILNNITSLQGIQGTQGTQGAQGTVGSQGIQGIQGEQGIIGSQGTQGIQGTVGSQGIQGIQGEQGIIGSQGIQGAQGIQGDQGIIGLQGIQGISGPQTLTDSSFGTTLIWNEGILNVSDYVSLSYSDSKWIDINRNGFINQIDTSIGFDETTRIFTLSTSEGVGSWNYLKQGIKYTITGDVSVQIPDVRNLYFIYIDSSDGNLLYNTTSWSLTEGSVIPVALLFYDPSTYPKYQIGEERHTCLIDRRQHTYLHNTFGTRYISGGNLIGPEYLGNSDVSIWFGVEETKIADEDIFVTNVKLDRPNSDSSIYTIFYRTDSSTWSWKESNMPYLYENGSLIQWDNNGVLTTANDNEYVCYYLLFTTIKGNARFSLITGQHSYTSLLDAQVESPFDYDFTGFPIIESVNAYKFIYLAQSAYSTQGKAVLVQAPLLINLPTTSNTSNILVNKVDTWIKRENTDIETWIWHYKQPEYAFDAAELGYYDPNTGDFKTITTYLDRIELYANGNYIDIFDTYTLTNIPILYDSVNESLTTNESLVSKGFVLSNFIPNTSANEYLKISVVPTTNTSSGQSGNIAFDSSYFYICTSTNKWSRLLLDNSF